MRLAIFRITPSSVLGSPVQKGMPPNDAQKRPLPRSGGRHAARDAQWSRRLAIRIQAILGGPSGRGEGKVCPRRRQSPWSDCSRNARSPARRETPRAGFEPLGKVCASRSYDKNRYISIFVKSSVAPTLRMIALRPQRVGSGLWLIAHKRTPRVPLILNLLEAAACWSGKVSQRPLFERPLRGGEAVLERPFQSGDRLAVRFKDGSFRREGVFPGRRCWPPPGLLCRPSSPLSGGR